MKKLFIFILLLVLIIPAVAFALNFEVGEEIHLNEIVNDDFYAAGGILTLSSNVNGDLVAAGGKIAIESRISQDLTLAGGEVIMSGEVGDDARLAGGNVTIATTIKDDLLVGGGNITLTDSGFVGGDLIIAGGNIVINGVINGSIRGGGGNIYINNVVRGDVELLGIENVKFGPNGKVLGDFRYKSPSISKHVTPKTVQGEVKYTPSRPPIDLKDVGTTFKKIIAWIFGIKILALLFVGLFFVWICRFYMTRSAETAFENPLKSLGLGLLVLIITPIAAIIALVTLIGCPLAYILMLMWLLVLFFGKLTAISIIGMKIVRIKDKSGFLKVYGAFALGVLIYVIIGLIPIIGWVLKLLLIVIGIGALTMYEKELFDMLRKKKLV
jgi:hypothetical protein